MARIFRIQSLKSDMNSPNSNVQSDNSLFQTHVSVRCQHVESLSTIGLHTHTTQCFNTHTHTSLRQVKDMMNLRWDKTNTSEDTIDITNKHVDASDNSRESGVCRVGYICVCPSCPYASSPIGARYRNITWENLLRRTMTYKTHSWSLPKLYINKF